MAKTTNIVVRFPPETHQEVKAAAARLGLSFNTYVVLVTGGDASRTLAEPERKNVGEITHPVNFGGPVPIVTTANTAVIRPAHSTSRTKDQYLAGLKAPKA
jgi:hypothetical protein